MLEDFIEPHFPENFVAIKNYPGYFWNTVTEELYTLKTNGVLRPLTKQYVDALMIKKSKFRARSGEVYYQISRDGKKRSILVRWILEKYLDSDQEIPVQGILL